MLFKALQIDNTRQLNLFAKKTGLSEIQLMLVTGCLNQRLKSLISENAAHIGRLLSPVEKEINPQKDMKPVFKTELGQLYQGDCLDLLRGIENDRMDLIFADPPFNLNKLYPSKINDNLKTSQYLSWCEDWAFECTRVLKPGGSLFIWNLPKWNLHMAEFLNSMLTFRHWISVDIKYSLPIRGRLYPSHYSLLYYCKGEKPDTFKPDRLPMGICPRCHGDLKDYGGYKDKMNPNGVNISDVWLDIPPVRHAKYKKRNGSNELSVKLLDRIIEMATKEGDLVFDLFGGSGTTYAVSELKNRRWMGVEIGPVEGIINRFQNLFEDRLNLEQIRRDINCLIPEKHYQKRLDQGLWTPESFRN
jgi:site-specific DNA-methyltransferase (adenine-specific)